MILSSATFFSAIIRLIRSAVEDLLVFCFDIFSQKSQFVVNPNILLCVYNLFSYASACSLIIDHRQIPQFKIFEVYDYYAQRKTFA